jgi:replicative superfamily II helicase
MISMEGRGDKVESAIMRFTKQNPTCRIVFLSATMKNVSELAKWLSFLNGKKTELINSAYRPIELGIHYETYKDKGRYAAVEENKIQKTLELIDSKRDEQFLIFVHAKATGRIIKERLEEIYGKKRVDFHYSELNLKDRLEIERKTKTKEIQFLVATSTLAFGINI